MINIINPIFLIFDIPLRLMANEDSTANKLVILSSKDIIWEKIDSI